MEGKGIMPDTQIALLMPRIQTGSAFFKGTISQPAATPNMNVDLVIMPPGLWPPAPVFGQIESQISMLALNDMGVDVFNRASQLEIEVTVQELTRRQPPAAGFSYRLDVAPFGDPLVEMDFTRARNVAQVCYLTSYLYFSAFYYTVAQLTITTADVAPYDAQYQVTACYRGTHRQIVRYQ